METKTIAMISAYARIVEAFAASCETENVTPHDAYCAVGRLLGFNQAPAASHQGVGSAAIATVPSQQIKLTPQQADEAKRIARAQKAKRLGLSPNEVNLTPTEAKAAKATMRESLAKGTPFAGLAPPTKPSRDSPADNNRREKETVSPAKNTLQGKTAPTEPKKVGVQADKTGSRATAKTKIDHLRRTTLRSLPVAIDDCRVIHLIAYCNHFNRLARQWDEYQKTYESSGMLNPLRGLPAPLTLPERLQSLVRLGVRGLREQSDSPGTYILQSDTGGSFWNQDRPSEVCPDSLKEPLSEEDLEAFDRACKFAGLD
jgi:hypothetical protein